MDQQKKTKKKKPWYKRVRRTVKKGAALLREDAQDTLATVRARLLRTLKNVLRFLIKLKKPVRYAVLLGSAALLLAIIIVPISVSAAHRRMSRQITADMEAAATPAATATPVPTPVPTETPLPTETPIDFSADLLQDRTIKKGDTDPVIEQVQSRLMALGYMDQDEPTQFFGSLTRDAVKSFQSHNALEDDGVIGATTYATMMSDDAKPYVMQLGDSGDMVESVQQRLYELGFLAKDSITGNYGEKTVAAVKAFQDANKLDDDGKIGSMSMETLYGEDVKGNVLERGDSDEVVKTYKQLLQKLGYFMGSVDKRFDSDMQSAVKNFQEAVGLEADGKLGPSTMEAISGGDAPSFALRLGASGSEVEDVQTRLYKMGYLSSSSLITGYYGEKTVDAVKAFQKRNSLTSDGEADAKTITKLNSSNAKKASGYSSGSSSSSSSKSSSSSSSSSSKSSSSSAKVPSASDTEGVKRLVEIAKSKLGAPYVRGSKGPDAFDCSGFVYWCLRTAGVKQGYLTSSNWRKVTKYSKIRSIGDLEKGDIAVFDGHVGICIGGEKMIDASSNDGQVRTTSLDSKYWKSSFICGFRIW